MRKFITALAVAGALAVPAVASANAGQGSNSVVASNAQCGTQAASGAFADVNGNFGFLGTERTPPGANGYLTGLNNSAVCGSR